MSTTITSTTDLLSAAETKAKKATATNAAASSSSSSTTSTSDALSSLTSNYNQFLTLLTTQLQNQDPTSPMQSDSFTSELAQFAGVEQQINTNTNLTQLISLSQANQVDQGSSLVGRQAVVSTSQLPLQNGQAELQLNPTTSGTVAIAITNSAGSVVKTQTLDLSAGTTDWTWDGKDDSGNTLTDGAYNVAVETTDASGNATDVPFNVIGTVTGISKSGSTGVSVQMGTTTVDMSSVSSMLGSASTTTSTSS